ncbi:MAG TPA: FAD-dependent oxidoreductase [Steroidobacteraceae bacterium]|nr:FAD-dependent oxidoreductase [Steroidobacteraceae bacterium]
MALIEKALIVGGGIAGMAAAIELRKRGVAVDLIELDPEWRVYGAGITINGAALRAFKTLGVVEEVVALGWMSDGCDICAAGGAVLAKIPTPRIAGPDIPGGGGILRPVLARILSKATLASGTSVRLGTSFESIAPAPDRVGVRFTDGSRGEYDLLIGADGLFSKVRSAVFPEAPKPRYTGQGCWRAVVPRPADITAARLFMGAKTKAGVNPVSRDEMYLFCVDGYQSAERIPEKDWAGILTGLLAEFTGPIGTVRDGLNAGSRILYRPLESVLVALPWHRGRIVLMGDAAHATTPHLASGAAISVEDAIVLAEELGRAESLETALRAYETRRFTRCKMVVESSLRLGELEVTGGSKDEHARVMRDSMTALLEPI